MHTCNFTIQTLALLHMLSNLSRIYKIKGNARNGRSTCIHDVQTSKNLSRWKNVEPFNTDEVPFGSAC